MKKERVKRVTYSWLMKERSVKRLTYSWLAQERFVPACGFDRGITLLSTVTALICICIPQMVSLSNFCCRQLSGP